MWNTVCFCRSVVWCVLFLLLLSLLLSTSTFVVVVVVVVVVVHRSRLLSPERKVPQTKEPMCACAHQWHKTERARVCGWLYNFDNINATHKTICDYTTQTHTKFHSVIDAFVLCYEQTSNYFYVYEYLNWNLISLQNNYAVSHRSFESYQNLT